MYYSLIEMITIYSLKYESAFVNDFRNHYDLFLLCAVTLSRLLCICCTLREDLIIEVEKLIESEILIIY